MKDNILWLSVWAELSRVRDLRLRACVSRFMGTRRLVTFLQEQGKNAPHGYIICHGAYPMKHNPQIFALTWFCS
jgi:hypothetical protein